MSQQYTDTVQVRVAASSDIEGRSKVSVSEVVLPLRVRSSGFSLAGLRLSGKQTRTLPISSLDFEERDEDRFYISQQKLNKYILSSLGDDVYVDAILTDGVYFRFARREYKKLPIVPVCTIHCRNQYMAIDGLSLSPDSVAVYGEPAQLEKIDHILTQMLSLRDLDKSVHGNVGLETPPGLELSQENVRYSVEVSRYVEIDGEYRISVRNAPAGVKLSVLPSSVRATFRCTFPMGSQSVEQTSFFVDYKDFLNSKSGKCAVRYENMPKDVLSCVTEPEFCDCFEESAH